MKRGKVKKKKLYIFAIKSDLQISATDIICLSNLETLASPNNLEFKAAHKAPSK